MNHIRDIIKLVMALRKSQNALYEMDHILTKTKTYDDFPDHRKLLWDAVKLTEEVLDKIDEKGE